MASLVDYEDSDSDQDCGSGAPPSHEKPFITSPSSSSLAPGGPCDSLSLSVAPCGSSSVAPGGLYSSSSMTPSGPCGSSSSSVAPGGLHSSSAMTPSGPCGSLSLSVAPEGLHCSSSMTPSGPCGSSSSSVAPGGLHSSSVMTTSGPCGSSSVAPSNPYSTLLVTPSGPCGSSSSSVATGGLLSSSSSSGAPGGPYSSTLMAPSDPCSSSSSSVAPSSPYSFLTGTPSGPCSSSSSSSVAPGGPYSSSSSLVAPAGLYNSSFSSVTPGGPYSSSSSSSSSVAPGGPYNSSSSSVAPAGPYSSSSSSVAPGGPQKRLCVQSCAVRPYVPKRQRVCAVGPLESAPPGPSVSPLLSGVSERLRPFLSGGPVRAQLPRRMRCGVQGHQSPVTALQWSPEPQHSHLLLSASMDNSCKVWDGVDSGRCLHTYSAHQGAVRDACWLADGRRLLSGSFDGSTAISDLETGQVLMRMENGFKVCCVASRPSEPDVFLCGGFSPEVRAWDSRCCKVLHVYRSAVQQTLDLLFVNAGREFVSSTDAVSRDSADRTLIAWDFQTNAKLSNQIFHERYTCPCLTAHPLDNSFIAQTNGNYIALFSDQRPYRMNKRRRYEGHKVEGFAVHCGFSADGSVVASGSSTGSVHFYDYQSSRTLKTLQAHEHACVCVEMHPIIPGVAATADWTGQINLWT